MKINFRDMFTNTIRLPFRKHIHTFRLYENQEDAWLGCSCGIQIDITQEQWNKMKEAVIIKKMAKWTRV